jgi:hypothetical protein
VTDILQQACRFLRHGSCFEEEGVHRHRPFALLLNLSVLALAFGWIEATVVVYLREIAGPGSGAIREPLPPVPIASRLLAMEVAREAWTLVLLGAGGWLAGSRWAERVGAFLLLFGVWDLVYYGVLKLLLGWPESLTTWDVLFLIPRPWVAPVWAPALVAVVFVATGTFLLWTAARPRRYRPLDVAILLGAALVVVASFLVESGVAGDGRAPSGFPVWLYGSGVLIGTSWFVRVETRTRAGVEERPGH